MNNQEIITALAEILEMEAGELTFETALDTIDTWDSLATISFIALVDEKTGHILAGDDLQKAITIGDLVALAMAGVSAED